MASLEEMMRQWGCATLDELLEKHRGANAAAAIEFYGKLATDNRARAEARAEEARIRKLSHFVVIGANGNMGQRYTKWLKELGRLVVGIDVNASDDEWQRYLEHAVGVVVATPTAEHARSVLHVLIHRMDVPILVEKPFSKDPAEIALLDVWEKEGVNLQMVDQYAHLPHWSPAEGDTTLYQSPYSGKDGVAWDCINIIAKANNLGRVVLDVQSGHEWRCTINGSRVEIGDMDGAYRAMVKAWVAEPRPNYDYIRHAHGRVLQYVSQCAPQNPTTN
jgi:hypothetical protein